MKLIVGVAGFTGTGKTTAVSYLAPRLKAEVVYLGQAVIDEVIRRNLEVTPPNERAVRMEMRASDSAALPRRMLPKLQQAIDQKIPIVLDAVMSPAEQDCLVEAFGRSIIKVVSFTASVDTRLSRVRQRKGKTATISELLKRDEIERGMGIAAVVDNADFRISNGRGLARFHDELHKVKLALLRGTRSSMNLIDFPANL